MTLLIVVLAIAITSTLPTMLSVLLSRGLGVGVPLVEFGAWGPKARLRIGSSNVRISPWLFSSSHALKDDQNLDLYGDAPGRSFSSLHPLVRSVVVASGPLLLLLLVTAVIGRDALASFIAGFGQLLSGANDPTGYAQQLLDALALGAATAPGYTLAILLTKLCAFTLLPIPTLPGGNALMQLLRWRRPEYPGWAKTATGLGLFLLAAMLLSWAFAFVWFLMPVG